MMKEPRLATGLYRRLVINPYCLADCLQRWAG
jgi:hypothetical protein